MALPLGLAGPFAFNTTLSIRPLLIGPEISDIRAMGVY